MEPGAGIYYDDWGATAFNVELAAYLELVPATLLIRTWYRFHSQTEDDEFVPKQGDCKLVDSKRTGNKLTYKMTCSTPEPSTAEGEMVFGTGAYEGKMRLTMTKTNQSMQMTHSGKRVGSCTAPAK